MTGLLRKSVKYKSLLNDMSIHPKMLIIADDLLEMNDKQLT